MLYSARASIQTHESPLHSIVCLSGSARHAVLIRNSRLASRAHPSIAQGFFSGERQKWQDTTYPVYGEIAGPIVMIGFGSIGHGTLPLIERHFKYDKNRLNRGGAREDAKDAEIFARHGVRHVRAAVTKDNYKELLKRS